MKRKTINKIIGFGVLTMLLWGCSLAPKYQQAELNEPQTFMHDTLPYDSLRSDTVLNLRWWEMFKNNELNDLVNKALQNNKNVAMAAARLEEARAALGYTQSDQYPFLNVQAGAGSGNFSGMRLANVTNNFFLMPALNWELDFWGKYRSASNAARAEMLASEANMRAVQMSLIAGVTSTYFALLDYQQRLTIAQKTFQARDSSLLIIKQRFAAGIIPEIDLNQAEIQTAIAQSAIPYYKRLVNYTETALSVMLGEYPMQFTPVSTINDINDSVVIPSGMPSGLLQRRPDVLAAEQSARAANDRIGVAIAMRFPAISLTGMLGAASSDLSTITSSGLAWSAGASLAGPIFNFRKNKKRVDMERARAKQAQIAWEQTALTAFKEVEDALYDIQMIKEEVKAMEIQAAAAMNAEALSRDRYDKGVTSYLEFLEAQRNSFDAQLRLSDKKTALLQAYMNLYLALGGGWLNADEEAAAQNQGQ